jgi:integrase
MGGKSWSDKQLPVVKLSPAFVRDVQRQLPQSGAVAFFDESIKGLMLELRASGTGTWYFRYRDTDKRLRLKRIGRLDGVAVTTIRKQAKAMRAALKAGDDPASVMPKRTKVLRFDQFVDQHYFPHVRINNRSWPSTKSQISRHLMSRFGALPLDQIHRADILAMQQSTRAEGMAVGTCNRLLIHMRTIFNAAIRWEILPEGSNPCRGVKPMKGEVRRERFLTSAEVQRLFDALDRSRSPQLAIVARMLLYTGARKREILDARWEHIDFERCILTVPRAKSGYTRHIPLSQAAMDIVNAQPRRPGNPWVFPNPKTGKPIVSLHAGWDAVRRRAGLPDVRLHDLRHSFASFLVNAGHSLYEVQALLGHQSPKMTMRYAHLAPETLLRAANSVAGALGTPG